MQKIDQISQSFGHIDRQRNVKWDLNKLEFSNLFAYGEDNSIDFEKLPGITGIFGKNRSGKSSIIGSIVYALFNTTDRGSLKNLHVINTKKDTCSAKAVIKIGQDSYSILRETKKNFPKKADVWASTTLSITKNELDAENTDLNDEQRRETEKVLRSLIGTADDFFYTCLAAQGQMNSFILEKSSARKQMLGRFLDIDYFEELNDAVKLESAQYRQKIKSIGQNVDFETQIKTLQSDIVLESNKKSKLKQKLSDLRSDLLKYSQDFGVEFITQDQLNICTNDVAKLDENTKLIEDSFLKR
jgi:DNA repair exonuclease SbcCD ATPase subunit